MLVNPSDCNADPRHRRRIIRNPATIGQALRAAWPKGRPQRLTVADHWGSDAVSCPKCTWSTLKTGDLERFRPESALGPLQKCETQSSFMAKVSAVS